jgi:hypothetical protein
MIPTRIQRSRKKGYRQPEGTKYVGRGTKFGNPFRLTNDGMIEFYDKKLKGWLIIENNRNNTIETVCSTYKKWLSGLYKPWITPIAPTHKEIMELSKYRHLSCFCSLDSPCHADVLINYIKERI